MSKPRFVQEARTKSYMIVHPKVVRETGSANNALLLIRMTWRCEEETPSTRVVDGRIWWAATAAEMSIETGLEVEQVRYSLKQLRERGFIDELDRGRGNAKWYSPSDRAHAGVSGYPDTALSDHSDTPSGISEGGVSGNPEPLLSIETGASGGPSTGTSASATDRRIELFERVWTHWPRKDSKKKAVEKFARLKASEVVEVARAIVAHGDAHAKYTPTQYVPHLVTWLNQERWNDPLPQPRNVGGRQDADLALIASYRGGGDVDYAALEG